MLLWENQTIGLQVFIIDSGSSPGFCGFRFKGLMLKMLNTTILNASLRRVDDTVMPDLIYNIPKCSHAGTHLLMDG